MTLSELAAIVDAATPRGFYTQVKVARIRDDLDTTRVYFEWEIYACHYGDVAYREDAPYCRVAADTIDGVYAKFGTEMDPWINAQLGKPTTVDACASVDI